MIEKISLEQTKALVDKLRLPIELWGHQKDAIHLALNRKHFGFLHEQGCGKTLTTICCLRFLATKLKRAPKLLILCPKTVQRNWQNEFRKFAPKLADNVVIIGEKSKRAREKKLKDPTKSIYIINYELLLSETFDSLSKFQFDAIICDEFHKLKDISAKRTKVFIKLIKAQPNAYRYVITGTPILNGPLDSYMLLKVVNDYPVSFFSFRLEFFYDANQGFSNQQCYFPKWLPRKEMMPKLNAMIALNTHRVTKDECMDLPPLVRQTVYVPFHPEQKRIYKELERDYVAQLEGNKYLTADLAITRTMKLQQICSGIITFKGQDHLEKTKIDTALVPTLKYDVLVEQVKDILENPTSKVIIWCSFAACYDKIVDVLWDKLAEPVARITGKETIEQRDHAIYSFQNDPLTRVVLANQQCAGTGINLTAANYMIYFAKNWSLENDLQSEARNHRGGSEIHEKITRIDLCTEDSIEEDITKALANKASTAEFLLDVKRRMNIDVSSTTRGGIRSGDKHVS